MGRGPTFNSTFHVKYGTVSARLKTSALGGSITAFVLIADNGDEIDFEFIGGDPHTVYTNFFYNGERIYDVNGASHNVPGAAVSDDFHTYTIDWKPESITWLVDGQVIRVQEKSTTCDNGVCRYPTFPA